MKVLFICNFNMNRSKTAKEIFANRWETESAGLYSDPQVTKKQIDWADKIYVMTNDMERELKIRFSNVKATVLDIPNRYGYMQPELIELLKKRL